MKKEKKSGNKGGKEGVWEFLMSNEGRRQKIAVNYHKAFH